MHVLTNTHMEACLRGPMQVPTIPGGFFGVRALHAAQRAWLYGRDSQPGGHLVRVLRALLCFRRFHCMMEVESYWAVMTMMDAALPVGDAADEEMVQGAW